MGTGQRAKTMDMVMELRWTHQLGAPLFMFMGLGLMTVTAMMRMQADTRPIAMVTLTPTSITNKDMATLRLAMATTPCMATQPPTMALATLVSFLAVTWLMLELLIMELGFLLMELVIME